MYGNTAYDENKLEPEILLDKVIALKNAWQEHELKHRRIPDMEGEQSDEEGGMLSDYAERLASSIVKYITQDDRGLDTKLRCIVLLNSMHQTPFQDLIDECDQMHGKIAWSIVRDLANARLNLADSGLPPGFTGTP
ncbi:hypothetical protein [Methylobacterium sp. Leaf99]|uniref:hypothetical protein n=1 Tax=Methylobacterium sp. Leaf99 TaxID=1736251 RepID=UPI0012EDFE2F|nr:hypothetical protein [Methylobacterium sp. Leaf99]